MTALKCFSAGMLLLAACNKPDKIPLDTKRELSEKTGIELAVIRKAEEITHADATRFKRWFSLLLQDKADGLLQRRPRTKTVELPGISLLVNGDSSIIMVDSLNRQLEMNNCIAFVSDDTYRDDKKQMVSIIRSADKYDIVRMQETHGSTEAYLTDSLIARLKYLEQKYAFEFIAVGEDWMLLRPKGVVIDWIDYASETLKAFPPEDHIEDVAAYADALKEEEGKVLLCWD